MASLLTSGGGKELWVHPQTERNEFFRVAAGGVDERGGRSWARSACRPTRRPALCRAALPDDPQGLLPVEPTGADAPGCGLPKRPTEAVGRQRPPSVVVRAGLRAGCGSGGSMGGCAPPSRAREPIAFAPLHKEALFALNA